jgi:uncharacterized membrane protein
MPDLRPGLPREFFAKSRVEAFSDGVFAIIVTLLVLELKPPVLPLEPAPAALGAALLALLPKFGSWVVSFFIVCVTWANHHRLLAMFRVVDHSLFWLNAHLLFWISFIPFPAALVGTFFTNPLALAFFGVSQACTALAFSLLRLYVQRRHPLLLKADVDPAVFRQGTRLSLLFGPLPYLVGAALAWAWYPATLLIYGFVPLYFISRRATRLDEADPKARRAGAL